MTIPTAIKQEIDAMTDEDSACNRSLRRIALYLADHWRNEDDSDYYKRLVGSRVVFRLSDPDADGEVRDVDGELHVIITADYPELHADVPLLMTANFPHDAVSDARQWCSRVTRGASMMMAEIRDTSGHPREE